MSTLRDVRLQIADLDRALGRLDQELAEAEAKEKEKEAGEKGAKTAGRSRPKIGDSRNSTNPKPTKQDNSKRSDARAPSDGGRMSTLSTARLALADLRREIDRLDATLAEASPAAELVLEELLGSVAASASALTTRLRGLYLRLARLRQLGAPGVEKRSPA
jgi:hypothetical protein